MLAWFLKKPRGKNATSFVLFAFLLFALVPALAFALEPGEKCTGASQLLPSCWLEAILNVLGGILNALINPLAGVVKVISNTLASVMVTTIKYVLSVPVSPGNPDAPAFLREIWNFSRALTNSFFVLLLAIIGLATILRVQSYQWQKTLPSLLIAVLLVNFSGVFVGLVVDFSNIVSNAFISSVSSGTNWSVQSEFAFTGNGVQELAFHIGEIIFYAFIAFVYLATLVLFVLRTIVLWIIAALAPIAFGLYVLPATNSYWQQWFKALIQWSIMGIPISFAIFFASAALTLTGQSIGSGDKPAFFAQAAGPFTAVVILIMGVGMALAGAPAISQSVMKFGRSLPKRIGNTRIGAKVLGGAAGGAAGVLAGARVGRRLEGLIEKTPGVGRVLKYAARPLSAAEGALGARAIEYAAAKRKWQPPKNWEQMGVVEQQGYLEASNLGTKDLVQAAAKMGKNLKYTNDDFKKKVRAARDKSAGTGYLHESIGTINDVMPETVTKDVRINMEVAMGMSRDAAKTKVEGELKTIVDQIRADAATDNNLRIALNTELASGKTEEDIAAAVKTAKELKPQDIANVFDPQTLSFRLAMRTSNHANLQRVQDNFGREVLDNIFNGPGGINSLTRAQLEKQNPQMIKYFTDTPLGRAMPWTQGEQPATTPPPPPTAEEQTARDLAASKTRLEGEIGQLNARVQELQNFIQQAQGPAGIADSAYQQQLPAWEAELANTRGQAADIERQLRDVSEGLRQIEGLRVPQEPAALPKIQLDMPSQLQGTIKRGSAVVQTIKDMTQEMRTSLGGIRDTQTDFNEVLGEMENVQRQVAALDQQEQLGALGPDLKAKRDELQGNLRDLAQSRQDLRQEIAQQTETAIRTKEAIDAKKADLEGIREEIAPLQEEYEGVKTREARETRIKQRRKRKS